MSIARKVQLTAFQNQLVSKPMNWPAEMIGQDIWLIMDMEMPSYETKKTGKKIFESSEKKCRFQFTGRYSMDGVLAIYKLVEVTS
jgi:hypothetical protein